ncbi:GTPase ObgE [Blattabacterium cuenoti]|uniref:GTPase ObgE n=1 Tax=Blattabacterium cuenoti TaxID=1653831 RepID=UPI00163BC088|nr:GTPase ObgE [Blattabacterium cuenoti]
MEDCFIDFIKIFCKSGDGGDGCIHFQKKKRKSRKIPDGGSGGKGGDIIIQGNSHISNLFHLRYKKHCIAQSGYPGDRKKITGAKGKNLVIEVPIGTLIKDEKKNILIEIHENLQKKILLQGGKGGIGNSFLKNKKSMYFYNHDKNGKKTKGYWMYFEMKMLSDVGIIGPPNVGKSTLLSKITNAKPKIGNYSFSNKIPYLGVVKMGFENFLVSDIPGIVNKASEGKGLGHYFLRHIEKNSVLLILISSDFKNKKKRYFDLLLELKKFNKNLLNKKRLLVISKSDLIDKKEKEKIKEKFENIEKNIIFISSLKKEGLDKLRYRLFSLIQK